MPFSISKDEILETVKMLQTEKLDIRTITMGINIQDCRDIDGIKTGKKVYAKIADYAKNLVQVGDDIEKIYGIPVINKRIAVSPVSIVGNGLSREEMVTIGRYMDQAAQDVGVNFIGGFTALVHKGFSNGDRALIEAIPETLAVTERVCASVNLGTTKAGINMDAVYQMGHIIKATAELTGDRNGLGCAKLVVFCNAVEDNPFMAGAFHGIGEPESTINIGISGPGVILNVVKKHPDISFGDLANIIKNTAFKITRMGELVGRAASERLGVPFGIVDVSLAPTPAIGDSVAEILKAMGLEMVGAHGSTAALALLNDAVKKGGAMASSNVGGLSGAFIPVSEDAGMMDSVVAGALNIDKLEAMTSVCSVGLDMIAIPGDTSAATISGIIADEAAIGMINRKTTAVRLIPAPGKKVGDWVEYGGLLGRAPVMAVSNFSSEAFIKRQGRIPAPIHALNN
ncbi:MAG TPA: PFL family protein [Syntrophomonadaceae bacterium]|nr:PFL family protein [Syntrophomonadaceae bacterium]HNX29147.1 PFL family protein [Syntrophomonadaceae bacterium]HPR93680.1 PFL family protein [Syntrophomonadaceae bacterium]